MQFRYAGSYNRIFTFFEKAGCLLLIAGLFSLFAVFLLTSSRIFNSDFFNPLVLLLLAGFGFALFKSKFIKLGAVTVSFVLGTSIASVSCLLIYFPWVLLVVFVKNDVIEFFVWTYLGCFIAIYWVYRGLNSEKAAKAWQEAGVTYRTEKLIMKSALISGFLVIFVLAVSTMQYQWTENEKEAIRRAKNEFGTSRGYFVSKIIPYESQGKQHIRAIVQAYNSQDVRTFSIFWTK